MLALDRRSLETADVSITDSNQLACTLNNDGAGQNPRTMLWTIENLNVPLYRTRQTAKDISMKCLSAD